LLQYPNRHSIYEGRTESHEQHFFACKPGTADEGDYGGSWNQLLCYPRVSCDVNSLHHVTGEFSHADDDDDEFKYDPVSGDNQ
jgi:hypothetical protein